MSGRWAPPPVAYDSLAPHLGAWWPRRFSLERELHGLRELWLFHKIKLSWNRGGAIGGAGLNRQRMCANEP